MIKQIVRPNGNLTLYEYDNNGRVINKIIQKGAKDIVSCFDNHGKFIVATVYDNKDAVTIHNAKGELVAELGKKVTRLVPDQKATFLDKILMKTNKKFQSDYKLLTKSDGLQYLRPVKKLDFSPEKHFSQKILDFVLNVKTNEIKALYAKLLEGRKVF